MLDHHILVTLDVVALYTNIHQKEAYRILAALPISLPPRLPKRFLLQLLSWVLDNNYFLYDQKYYHQKFGVAMGATVAPSVAALYMSHFEDTYLYDSPGFRHISIWKRFLDDVFFIWTGSTKELQGFLLWVNTLHEHIQFEAKQHHSQIEFLDMLLYKEGHQLQSTLYRKPVQRNTLLQFTSYHP